MTPATNSPAPSRRARLMQGNEACAEAAVAAGCRFFAGYPITPSSEIAEILAERLPQVGGVFIQMEDEIASMAAVIGASLAGRKSMTATSGPGFSLKQENLGYAALTEVPCVVVNVQRVGPSTGMPTSPAQGDVMQARWGTHGDHPIIVLTPFSVREVYDLTIRAFNWSEGLRVPVILLMDEVIGHLRERVILPEPGEIEVIDRQRPAVGREEYRPYEPVNGDVPPMAAFGDGFRFHVTGLFHDPTGFPTNTPAEADGLLRRICGKIERRRDVLALYDEVSLADADVAVLAYGCSARSALGAVRRARQLGIRAGLFRPITIWPFADGAVRDLAGRVRAIIVPEMNLGQLAGEVERAVAGRTAVHRLNRVDSELITPAEILAAIEEVAGRA